MKLDIQYLIEKTKNRDGKVKDIINTTSYNYKNYETYENNKEKELQETDSNTNKNTTNKNDNHIPNDTSFVSAQSDHNTFRTKKPKEKLFKKKYYTNNPRDYNPDFKDKSSRFQKPSTREDYENYDNYENYDDDTYDQTPRDFHYHKNSKIKNDHKNDHVERHYDLNEDFKTSNSNQNRFNSKKQFKGKKNKYDY